MGVIIMINALFNIFDSLLNLLPDSPFQSLNLSLSSSEFLGFMNWFLPIDRILSIMQLWLSAIIGFYVYKYARKYVSKVLSIFMH